MKRPSAGMTFLVGAVLLASLVFLNFGLALGSMHGPYDCSERCVKDPTSFTRGSAATSFTWSPHTHAGDRIHFVSYHLARMPVEVWVVEGGEGKLLANGTTPPHVYGKVVLGHVNDDSNLTFFQALRYQLPGGSALDPGDVDVTRPAPPAGAEGQRVDVVWLVRADNLTTNSSSLGDAAVQAFQGAVVLGPDILALDGVHVVAWYVAGAQVRFYVAEAAVAIVTLAAGAVWLRRALPKREVDEPPRADTTEALVQLAERAGRYLERLRDLLLWGGVVLVFLVLFGAWALNQMHLNLVYGEAWEDTMQTWFIIAFAAVALAWAVSAFVVWRELRRWRARTQEPPLGL